MRVCVTPQDPIGVTLGGVIGHALCTLLAVVGGRLVAQRISVRSGLCTLNQQWWLTCTVHLIGGVVFLLFAITGILLED